MNHGHNNNRILENIIIVYARNKIKTDKEKGIDEKLRDFEKWFKAKKRKA